MNKPKIHLHFFASLLVAALALGAVPSFANVLEEIVVTAQKQEESLQSVPISITALTGDQLSQLGYGDTTEITQQIPGLQLNTWSPNLTIFNLRGISQNNFTDNLEAPVAVYLDDAYMGSINGISGQLFDVKRVEVLRGPQGTLFGRNATGGLIHYLSKGADETELDGYIRTEVGSYNTQNIEFAVGGGSEKARARLAVRIEEADGYIESQDTFINSSTTLSGSGQDIGGKDGLAYRLNVQFDINDRLSADFWYKYSEDDDVPTGGYVFENCAQDADLLCPIDDHGRSVTSSGVINGITGAPASVHEHFGEQVGHLERETTSFQGRFDYEIDDNTDFVSITNQLTVEKDYLEDGDAIPATIVNFQTISDYEQFSQEFRFSGDQGSWRWQAGLYYLDIQADNQSLTTGAPAYNNIANNGDSGPDPSAAHSATRLGMAGGVETLNMVDDDDDDNTPPVMRRAGNPRNSYNGAVGIQTIDFQSENTSLFGQFEFDVTDNFAITAGLRWSQDIKDIDWQLTYTDNSNTDPILIETSENLASQAPDVDEIDYDDFAARFALNWQANDDTLLFFSFNRGIKGGNWATGVGAALSTQTFRHDEEVLISYEFGVKADLGDSARINATLFVYDYQDYQVFSLAGGSPFVENTDAEASGLEVELFWVPRDGWDISLGATFMDSSVDEVRGPGNSALITDAVLPNAPEFSTNFLVRYTHLFNDEHSIAVQLDGVHYDDQFLEVTNGSGTEQEAYSVANLRFSYTIQENISFTAWVKNLTDEEYKLYSLDLGFLGVTTYYAPPMTSGITFEYRF